MRYRADPLCSQKMKLHVLLCACCPLGSLQCRLVCPEDLFERQALVESLN